MIDPTALMLRFQQHGDASALEALRTEMGPKLETYFRSRGKQFDVDDLCQKVWIRVWKYRAKFDPAYTFSQWAFTIAHRVYCRYYQQAKKRPAFELLEGEASTGVADYSHVRDCIDKLPCILQAVYRHIYVDGMTVRECGSKLGLSKSEVGRLHLRLQERLKRDLGAE